MMIEQILTTRGLTKLDIIERIEPYGNDVIYVTGSVIEGFANERSDLDVYLITNNKIKISQGVYQIKNENVDVEVWERSLVEDMIARLDSISFNPNDRVFVLDADERKFAQRLLIGLPIYNETEFQILKKKFNWSNLNGLNIRLYINLYDNLFEDIYGALISEDIYTAYLNSYNLLNLAMDVYLSCLGETNVQEKWRYRKMAKNLKADDQYMQKYMQFYLQGKTEENLKGYIEEVLTFSEKLIQKANTIYGGF